MKFCKGIAIELLLAGCIALTGPSARGQNVGGTIEGSVVDVGGASFPQAHVLLINLGTFKISKIELSSNGKFRFSGLPTDGYIVIAADKKSSSCLLPFVKQVSLFPSQTVKLKMTLRLNIQNHNCLEPVQ